MVAKKWSTLKYVGAYRIGASAPHAACHCVAAKCSLRQGHRENSEPPGRKRKMSQFQFLFQVF